MASKKHFHVRHGLTAGTGVDNNGTPTREVITKTGQLVDVGALSSLATTNKTNIVAAINEVNSAAGQGATIDDIIALSIALG